MTGLEKIIEEICNEAAKEAQSIIEKAEAEAAEILEQAKAQMQAKEAETAKAAEAEVAELVRSRDSALHLQRRKRILATKQASIAEALQKAKQTLLQLPDEEYFKLLAGLIKKAAQAQSGVLI
ncbi:MAG: V-type ATP synthase subunit E family protein, partial [Bacillota bacterium]